MNYLQEFFIYILKPKTKCLKTKLNRKNSLEKDCLSYA